MVKFLVRPRSEWSNRLRRPYLHIAYASLCIALILYPHIILHIPLRIALILYPHIILRIPLRIALILYPNIILRIPLRIAYASDASCANYN